MLAGRSRAHPLPKVDGLIFAGGPSMDASARQVICYSLEARALSNRRA